MSRGVYPRHAPLTQDSIYSSLINADQFILPIGLYSNCPKCTHHLFRRHFFFFTLSLKSASRTPHLVQWISICLLCLNTSDQSFLEVCLKQNQNHQKSLLRLRKHTLPSYKPNTRNFRLCRFPIQTRQGFAYPLAPPQDASFAWLSLMETQLTWPWTGMTPI